MGILGFPFTVFDLGLPSTVSEAIQDVRRAALAAVDPAEALRSALDLHGEHVPGQSRLCPARRMKGVQAC